MAAEKFTNMNIGVFDLAYRVKKNRKGHYVMLNVEADNDTLREYERIMGLNEDILRFMNIAVEEVEEGPSIMMQAQRAERAPLVVTARIGVTGMAKKPCCRQ